MFGGRKRTHLGTMFLILRDDCPENKGLVFAKYEEATGIVPLVARRCAFHNRRPLPFSAGCSCQVWWCPSTTAK